MKASEMFPSKWAKPVEDLKHNTIIKIVSEPKERQGTDFDGNPVTLFDMEIEFEDAKGEVQVKLFQLNAGNSKEIAALYGDDTKDWVGKSMACVLIASPKSKSGKRVVLTPPNPNNL